MTQVFGGFLLLLGGDGSCGEAAGCMAGSGPCFIQMCPSLSAHQNKN